MTTNRALLALDQLGAELYDLHRHYHARQPGDPLRAEIATQICRLEALWWADR